MTKGRRLTHYLWKFATGGREYRNSLLQLIDIQVSGVARHVLQKEQQFSLFRTAFADLRFGLIGGCELEYLTRALEYVGFQAKLSFHWNGGVDPTTELNQSSSPLWVFAPQVWIFSAVQLFRGLVQKTQLDGPAYSRADQDRDLEIVVGCFKDGVGLVRKRSAEPIFLLTYPYVYRPNFGLHEYKSFKTSRSLHELLRSYEEQLYAMARNTEHVYVLDVDRALELIGKERGITSIDADGIYDHFSKEGGIQLALTLLSQISLLSAKIRRIKCAAFDLDGTLWAGVLREDGPDGISVNQKRLNIMRNMMARGILVTICSKNDENIVSLLPQLLGQDLLDRIILKRIDWYPKSANLKRIAQELNIGLDVLAFFDDSEFEREEVKANAPEVAVFDANDILGCLTHPAFQPVGAITEESRRRVEMYHEETKRSGFERQISSEGFESFLHSINLRMTVWRPALADLPRAHELLVRTNQQNATGRRTDAQELRAMHEDPEAYYMVMCALRDRFGDYGTIGVAIAERHGADWELIELALSCRAMGRRVEHALLWTIGAAAKPAGARRLLLAFRPTARNTGFRELIVEAGFALTEVKDGVEMFDLDLLAGPPAGIKWDWLAVQAVA